MGDKINWTIGGSIKYYFKFAIKPVLFKPTLYNTILLLSQMPAVYFPAIYNQTY